MSNGAFLEEVAKLKHEDSCCMDGCELSAAQDDCWPEILAVVERLRFEHDKHDEEDSGGLPCRGCERLEALDKKAKGL